MQVGDLVALNYAPYYADLVGVIIDALESEDGWTHFEVMYTTHDGQQDHEWFSDLFLEILT